MPTRAGEPRHDAATLADGGARLRGDYSGIGPDYSVDQRWDMYTPAEHDLYRRLYERQSRLVPHYACREYITSLARLDAAHEIPRFDRVSRALRAATGWQIVAVPGLVPDHVFFEHLANRRFPVTVWLRTPEEFDYIVEPDAFHDFFGHVPMLFDPVFADYLQAYGQGGLKAQRLDALTFLARLYWYTVEFGLIATPQGLRAYGAGILSSGGELRYAIESPRPSRVRFDLERIMRTEYRMDRYQDTYFSITSFVELFDATAPDFTAIYDRVRTQPMLSANARAVTDVPVPRKSAD
jgi:phenylalanine-4-hydroxylase